MDPFGHSGRIPWVGDQPVSRHLHTQDSTTQKNEEIHPHLELSKTVLPLERVEVKVKLSLCLTK